MPNNTQHGLSLGGVVSGRRHRSMGRKKRPGDEVVLLAAGASEGRHPTPLFEARAGGQGIVLYGVCSWLPSSLDHALVLIMRANPHP